MADQIPDSTKSVRIALEDVTPVIAAAFADDTCLIWSGEHRAYWVAGGNGYTTGAADAGRWTIADAYQQTKHCDPSKQIAFERVDATRAAPPAMDREAVVQLKGDERDPYRFSGDEDEDGFVVTQHRFYKWGDDCIIALGELNTSNTWDDEAFDAKCQTLLSTLSADAIRQGKYLVWSNEHRAWWGPDECGYTRIIERAGRYDRGQAFSISSKRGGGWQREANPDEIAIPEADAIAQYAGPSPATPASHASDGGEA